VLIPSPLACLFRPTGNTKTAIIACVTSAQKYVEDTKGTLQFACSAKNIQTSVTVNEILDDQAQLRRLKKQLLKVPSPLSSVSRAFCVVDLF
jgi:hypothetical protein